MQYINILANKDSAEYEIVERQLVMKNSDEKRWVNEVKRILKTLGLPSAYELLENVPSTYTWKQILNSKMKSHVHLAWKKDVTAKSSLKYLNSELLKVGKPHPVWNSVSVISKTVAEHRSNVNY